MHDVETPSDLALPLTVPLVPDWDIEARLAATPEQTDETGAWFDVRVQPSGRAVLALGQVPGTGPNAARTAAQVQQSVMAAFAEQPNLERAWHDANSAVFGLADARDATALVVVLDLPDAEVWYATAGHDGPMFFDSSGVSRLPPTGSAPLGLPAPDTAHVGPVDGHVTVVLTSAVVNVPEKTALMDAPTAAAPPDAAAAAQAVLELSGSQRGPHPIAALVARHTRTGTPVLDHNLSPDTAALPAARGLLEDWLQALGTTPMDVLSLVHAALELLTNAIEHAPVPGLPPSEVHLRGEHSTTGEVVIDVIDHGQWRTPTYDIARGRGLAMAAGLAHELTVSTGEDGTRARLRHRLTRPVLTEVQLPLSAPRAHFEISELGPGRLRLTGVLANDDVLVLTDALEGRMRDAGVVELDLTDMTALSPAAISALGDLVGGDAPQDSQRAVRLRVRPGSVPQTELERAAIPFTVQ